MRKPLNYRVSNNVAVLLKEEKMKRFVSGGEKFSIYDIEKEVGQYCGVRREAIYAIKRGVSNAGLPIAFKIAEYFDLDIEKVFFLDKEEMNQIELDEFDLFDDIEEEEKKQVDFF